MMYFHIILWAKNRIHDRNKNSLLQPENTSIQSEASQRTNLCNPMAVGAAKAAALILSNNELCLD